MLSEGGNFSTYFLAKNRTINLYKRTSKNPQIRLFKITPAITIRVAASQPQWEYNHCIGSNGINGNIIIASKILSNKVFVPRLGVEGSLASMYNVLTRQEIRNQTSEISKMAKIEDNREHFDDCVTEFIFVCIQQH